MALAVPLSRFTSRVGGGSAFYVRHHYTLMKHMVTLFALSLLLVGCKRHLSDSEISRKAVGGWMTPHTTVTTDIRSDGSYFTSGVSNRTAGSWHVEGGSIVLIITNVSDHVTDAFAPSRFKVVSIDNHQMTIIPEGKTDSFTLTKP